MSNSLNRYLCYAIERFDEGVVILDKQGRILYITERAKKMIGLKDNFRENSLAQIFPNSILFQKMSNKLNSIEEILPVPNGDRDLFCLCRVEQALEDEEVFANIVFLKQQKALENHKEAKSYNAFYSFDDIIGVSKQIDQLKIKGKAFAQSDSTILLLGETGTGKELLAQALHTASPRREGPFIPVNCAAIPENLLESELFGYEEGSFTGARKGGKPGRFEIAKGGTIFLDEIGDMPLFLQAKLLRVLQEKRLERVGATKQIPIDVRIIAATHKDLEELVKQNKFRSDLFYRLNVLPLHIPSLRQRKEDIYVLLEHFLKKHTVLVGKTSKRFSAKVLNFFFNYSWPGNVRELENVVEYVVNLPNQQELFNLEGLPPYMLESKEFVKNIENPGSQTELRGLTGKSSNKNLSVQYQENVFKVKEMEFQQLLNALDKFGYSTEGKKKAAQELGIGLATLYRKLKEIKEGK